MDEKQMMDIAIERLRASKEKYEEKDRTQGKADGREWASTKAEYAELVGLGRTKFYGSWDDPFQQLRLGVDPFKKMLDDDFYQYCFGQDIFQPDDAYIKAFID